MQKFMVFYIDTCAARQPYEEFYDRLLEEDVHFVHGREAEITDWAVHAKKKESRSFASKIR